MSEEQQPVGDDIPRDDGSGHETDREGAESGDKPAPTGDPGSLDEIVNAMFSADPAPSEPDANEALRQREPIDELARRSAMLKLYQWFCEHGRVPSREQWSRAGMQPGADEIEALFGDWDSCLADIAQRSLPRILPSLRDAVAEERRRVHAARQQVTASKRDIERQGRRLAQREAEIRVEIERRFEGDLARATQLAQEARDLQCSADQAAAEAMQEVTIVRDELRLAELRSHALMRQVAECSGAGQAQFAAWYQFSGGSFDPVVVAAADAITGEDVGKQVVEAPTGSTEVHLGSGVLGVDRSHIGSGRVVRLTWFEPIAESSQAGIPVGAHLGIAVTVWRKGERVGALTEAHVVDAPPELPAAKLANISRALVEAAAPEPDGGWPIGSGATAVGIEEVGELVRFLTSEARTRPVLVVAAGTDGKVPCDADLLAGEVCGAAHVVTIDPNATFRLSGQLSAKLGVPRGHIRCYAPGFSLSSVPGEHRTIDPRPFSRERGLHNELMLLACDLDHVPDAVSRARRLSPGMAGDGTGSEEEGRQLARTRMLRKRNNTLEKALEELHGAYNALVDATDKWEAPPEATRDAIRTVADAITLAQRDVKHLHLSKQALKNGGESPFRRPKEVYDTLMLLDQLAGEYVAGGIGVAVGERAAQLGLTWRADVGSSARGRHAEDYCFRYGGVTLDLGPHVILSNGRGATVNCRIYFCVWRGSDELPRGIYVGHVGRHLPDSTTG